MKFPTGRALLCVLAILFPALGRAQRPPIKITYYSLFPNDAAVRQQCHDAAVGLVTELRKFPHQEGWTYQIVCDEASWAPAIQHEEIQGDPALIYGATDLYKHTTLLRGSALAGKDAQVSAEHLVAHELSHIALNSANEQVVEAQALNWMKAAPVQVAGVR